jgi:hypothetical protein
MGQSLFGQTNGKKDLLRIWGLRTVFGYHELSDFWFVDEDGHAFKIRMIDSNVNVLSKKIDYRQN